MIVDLLVAAIIVFDLWIVVNFLILWPINFMKMKKKYIDDGVVALSINLEKVDKKDLEKISRINPSMTVLISMLWSSLAWLWVLGWMVTMNSFGGIENFCSMMLDK